MAVNIISFVVFHASYLHASSVEPARIRADTKAVVVAVVRRDRPLGRPLKSAEEAQAITCVVLGI